MATHVREFVKPSPITLRIQLPDGSVREQSYTYEMYMGEFLWSYAKWNADDDWGDAQDRIGEALESPAAGELIKFESLSDFEKFHEANKAAQITGPHAHRVRKLQKAGKNARAPKPDA